MTDAPHYRITIRLERVTARPPDNSGYVRNDAETVTDLTLTGGSEQNVIGQASQHVEVLYATYAPAKAGVAR